MNVSSDIRWRQYVIARELIILGELAIQNRFTLIQLERISTQLRIPRSTLIKVSYAIGKKGKLGSKNTYAIGLIHWAKAVLRRDTAFFHCKPIWIE